MKTLSPGDKLAFSVPEALEIIGIGRSLFYREVATGRLTVRKVGRRTLVSREAIRSFLNGQS